jgi:alpha-acetolactate decarboxylase
VRNVDARQQTTENHILERNEEDNSRTNVVTELNSSLAYNDTRVNEIDNSRHEEQSTTYAFTDQDNSQTTYVNDNDTVFDETRSVTLAFPESRTVVADNSTTLNQVDNFENVDRSTSEINNIDASQTRYVTNEDPTYVFDNSSSSFLNFAAPERTGGAIVVGNA